MTPEDKRLNILNRGLFLPSICPSSWDWAKALTDHGEKGKVEIFFGRDKDSICDRFEWLRLCNCQLLRMDFLTYWFHNCHPIGYSTVRISTADEPYDFYPHPTRYKDLIGYFSPKNSRAVFYIGEEEPAGLLLFHIWRDLYCQNIDHFIRFFDNIPQTLSKLRINATEAKASFLDIRDLIGEDLDVSKMKKIAKDIVRKYQGAIDRAPQDWSTPEHLQALKDKYRIANERLATLSAHIDESFPASKLFRELFEIASIAAESLK